jgi:hypothetical protein
MKIFKSALVGMMIFLVPAILALGYSFMVKARIAEQAGELAHGRPYCILVAKMKSHSYRGFTSVSMQYEPADSFMDTMGWFMRGGKARNHAVLIIGYRENQVHYHWSYRSFGFMKGAHAAYGSSCAEYKYDYSSLQPTDYLDATSIAFNDQTYTVPLVYQPRSSSDNPETGVDEESFSVNAAWPDFTPVKDRCSSGVCHVITVSRSSGRKIDAYYTDVKPSNGEGTSVLYGLQKSAEPDDSGKLGVPERSLPWGTYYLTDARGDITTLARCFSSCDITFDQDGLRYSFSMKPENLRHWKSYEEKVVDFMGRFRRPRAAPMPAARGPLAMTSI